MKQIIALTLAISISLYFVVTSFATTSSTTFTVSATVPTVSGIKITPHRINGIVPSTFNGLATPYSATAQATAGTALSFDPLTFDSVNHIYTADHYFTLTATADGAPMDITVNYTEGNNPNNVTGGSAHGLGWKCTAAFTELTSSTTEIVLPNHPKKKLIDLQPEHILPGEIAAFGVVKVYLGIETNPSATGEPSGVEVFSGADKTGSYSGSVVLSVTAV